MEPSQQPPPDSVDGTTQPSSSLLVGRLLDTEFEIVLPKGACGFGIYFTAAADGGAVVDPTKPFYRLPDNAPAPGEASGVIEPGDRLVAINETSVERWQFADVVDELRRTPLGDATLRFRREATSDLHHTGDTSGGEAMPLERVAGSDDVKDTLAAALVDPEPKRVRWKLFDWPVVGTTTTTSTANPPTAASVHGGTMNRSAAMEELLVDMENRLRELEDAVEREKKCRFLAEKKNILYRNALCALGEENAQLRHALAVETHARETNQCFQQQHLQLSI